MCIAILNKKTELSRESLQNCWDGNSHGAGMLYTFGQQLERFTELDQFEVFYQTYIHVRAQTDLPMMLHFRIATSGEKNDTNCHPFLVPGTEWGLIHNGMLDVHSDKEYSDTWYFANRYLSELRDLSSPWSRRLITDLADGGYPNKLVFLNATGEFFFINEHKGHWDALEDTWYSNDGYKESGYSYYGSQRFRTGTRFDADDERYGSGYGDDKYTGTGTLYPAPANAVAVTGPKLSLFQKEREARRAGRKVTFGVHIEAEYTAWLQGEVVRELNAGLHPTVLNQFQDDEWEEDMWPTRTRMPFQDPAVEMKYKLWKERREATLLLAESSAAAKKNDSASSSVTASAEAGDLVISETAGCLQCGGHEVAFDDSCPGGGMFWCHQCDEYIEDDQVYEVGSGEVLQFD